jgi:formate hydrogenlyase subunit 6/NADH:ubiquinone oxidoreductase subunit I
MGTILYFIETTLLWIVAFVLMAGLGWRLLFFVVAIFRKRTFSRHSTWHRFITLTVILVPFHRAILKRPIYAAVRYAFHACLFIVPVWFSGHIVLWEESRLEWYWTPLPDAWADGGTLAVLGACVFFIIRRGVLTCSLETRISDFFLISITGMPFLSGYFLTHGHLSNIPFFDSYMWYLHVISGEIMLVMIVFLFCRTHLNKERCVGCAACVENCPTETLEFDDKGHDRLFNYSHYQCICCGFCVKVCPEGAATLRHELGPANLIRVLSKTEIRRVELKACIMCGTRFAPVLQLDKLHRDIHSNAVEIDCLGCCRRCRKLRSSRQHRLNKSTEPVANLM